MVDCSHMFAVCIKQNDKKKRMGETRGVEEVVGNRLWNRPALCCTWSPGLYERPPRISSLDTSVSKYQYFPWSFLSIFFKRRVSFAFPAAPDRLNVSLFCCFCVLIQLPPRGRFSWQVLDCRDAKNSYFMACGMFDLWRSQELLTAKPALLSLLWSAPKLLFVSTWTSMFS